jgi:hypothetical protein
MSSTAPHQSDRPSTGRAKGAKGDAKNDARHAGHEAAQTADSPWLKRCGQVGVAAIGVVYLLLAWVSLQVAFGSSGKTADNTGALKELAGNTVGRILLAVMAIGLFAFAVWQIALAAIGYRHEDEKKRVAQRVGAGAKAVFGAAIGVQALKLTISGGSKDSSQQQADWTGKLLGVPAGHVLVVLIGLGLIVFAGYLVYEGVEKKFLEKLDRGVSRTITRLGQVGWIARGVAFGVLGILVVIAGVKSQPEKARGLDQALKTLADRPFGKWILTAVALGFAGYALFQLITASKHKEG